MGDKGSAVIEMCIIAPIMISIIFLSITLFLDNVNDGVFSSNTYISLYSYDAGSDEDISNKTATDICVQSIFSLKPDIDFKRNNGNISLMMRKEILGSGLYKYEIKQCKYMTEYEACTKRLRRWQFYGDEVCE